MTTKEKLIRTLEINSFVIPFDTDSRNINSSFFELKDRAETLQVHIAEGNKRYTIEYCEKVKEGFKILKQLHRLHKREPALFDLSRGYNRNKFDDIFQLGYDYFPQGLKGEFDRMLYYSRLIRDAQTRCDKVNKNKQ